MVDIGHLYDPLLVFLRLPSLGDKLHRHDLAALLPASLEDLASLKHRPLPSLQGYPEN